MLKVRIELVLTLVEVPEFIAASTQQATKPESEPISFAHADSQNCCPV